MLIAINFPVIIALETSNILIYCVFILIQFKILSTFPLMGYFYVCYSVNKSLGIMQIYFC